MTYRFDDFTDLGAKSGDPIMNTLKELKLDKLKNIIKIIISFEVIIPSLQLNTRATELSYNENGRTMLKVPLNGL